MDAVGLLVFTASAISATADDEASAYLDQVEKCIMAAWKLPPKSDGLQVALRYTLAKNGSVFVCARGEIVGQSKF